MKCRSCNTKKIAFLAQKFSSFEFCGENGQFAWIKIFAGEDFLACLAGPNRLFWQEDAIQDYASIILLFEDVNYKVKSTATLLQASKDLLCVLF